MQNRFLDISYLRVIAMLLVVFGHCICPYSLWNEPGYSAGFKGVTCKSVWIDILNLLSFRSL